MAIDRRLWDARFWTWPRFPCPKCRSGTLRFHKQLFLENETADSIRLHSTEGFAPEDCSYRFTAILLCDNQRCKDPVLVCGKSWQTREQYQDPEGDWLEDYESWFAPHYFEPTPPVFPIPRYCPKAVTAELQKAFALMWFDEDTAGSRLRVAVEILMDELGIQKKTRTKKGQSFKLRRLGLHDRIQRLAAKNEEAAEQFMAIKWIGNASSHKSPQGLSRNELLDAFEHFEEALELTYVNRRAALRKRASAINRARGPTNAKQKKK